MEERIELGPLTAIDPRAAPARVEFLGPPLFRRVQWIAGAIASMVFVWSVALAGGWLRVDGWLVSTQRFPRGVEHVLWALPVLLGIVCLAMAVSGVRVWLDTERLGIFGIWPRFYGRSFDLAGLLGASFQLERTTAGKRMYRIRFVFSRTEIVLHTPDRQVWESLRARFRDRLGR